MSHELTTLPSGVRVVTETMTSVRSVSLGLWLAVGSRDEHPGQLGCSHFLEHTLFKGTATRSARDIAESLDAVGGELNAFTSKELTCFHARVLDVEVPVAFEVLADMLVSARNRPEDVEAERQVVLSELDALNDAPDELVHTEFCQLLLGEHPLAAETLGTLESISRLDRDTIHGYYLDRYRPEALVVAAAGNVEHDRVVALADQLLGDLGRPGGAGRPRTAVDGYHTGQVRILHRPSEQAHVVLGGAGLHHRDADRYAMRVLDTVLGGGMSSRLFQEIRERRGLAYAAFSYASAYTDAGLVGAYAGTAPGKVDEVLDVLTHELDRIVDDVTDAEVERAKGALTGGTVLGLEDTGSRMSRLGQQLVTGAELLDVDEALRRIAAVDLGAVRAVARRVLSGPRGLALVGPFGPHDGDRFLDVVA
ncbi:MAG: pitrilysin family protein [Nitriliruptoraceae bacterium]